jgi:translation initiation factor IF-3
VLRKKTKRYQPIKLFIQANHMIRFPQVRVLSERGEFVGVMSTTEAMTLARAEEKDLVLVTDKAELPITKIIELSKYKYQLQQKQAEGRKKARSQDTKETRLTPFIGENDLNGKINKIIGFLQKGHKAKLTMIFKGRQMANKDKGYEVVNKVLAALAEYGEVEIQPKLIGNKIQTQLIPAVKKSKKPTEVSATPAPAVQPAAPESTPEST